MTPSPLLACVEAARDAAQDTNHAAVKLGVLLHNAARLPDAHAAAELRRIVAREVGPLTRTAARAAAAGHRAAVTLAPATTSAASWPGVA